MATVNVPFEDQKTAYSSLDVVEPAAEPKERGCGARFAKLWREGHRQARIDIRQRWGRAAACLWLAGLITSFGLLYPFSLVSASDGTACLPDDSFSLYPDSYRYWSTSGFFDITLGFGRLSFTKAKVLDVGWDILFGRGGQTLLALASWSVFMDYITTSMEVKPVTYDTFRAIFIQDQSPGIAIPRMIRDFASRTGLHSTIAMIFIIYTMTYTWVFPTMASTMTAYRGNVKAFMTSADGNLVPLTSFKRLLYIIHDGARVGLGDNYTLALPDPRAEPLPLAEQDDFRYVYRGWMYYCSGSRNQSSNECNTLMQIEKYINDYTLANKSYVDTLARETIFGSTVLPSPRLNISIFRDGHNMTFKDLPSFLSPTELHQDGSGETMWHSFWVYGNQTYNSTWMGAQGRCQPTDTYQWGFSFVQLNLMILLLLIWTLGIMFMWLRAQRLMKSRGRTEVAGRHRAILDLASAMTAQLDCLPNQQPGGGRAVLTESEIDHAISDTLRGGTISYSSSIIHDGDEGRSTVRWGVWAYLRRNLWWLVSLVVFAVGSVFVGFYWFLPVVIFMVGAPLAIIVVLAVSTTPASRFAVFFWAFIALILVPQTIATLSWVFGNGIGALSYGRRQGDVS